MARVLVVDDEPRYRGYVARLLAAAGHRVRGAASAREAIERGARERPDVAVVDWMLGGALHGLHALDALRAVTPELACVLVTGFPSAELESSARRAGVTRLVEKPFEPPEIRAAVAGALADAPRARERGLALLELDGGRAIAGASPGAHALLEAVGLAGAATLDALFAPGDAPDPARAAERWVRGGGRAANAEPWWLRAQPAPAEAAPAATRLAVLHCGRAPPDAGSNARVELLLGLEPEAGLAGTTPLAGRVLLADPDLFLRRVSTSLLEETGVPVRAAESGEAALEFLEGAPGFGCAVVDAATPGLEHLVRTLRTRFPEVALVGQAEATPSEALCALGVETVLRKPWSLRRLVAALHARR